jgi:hypothetical protein
MRELTTVETESTSGGLIGLLILAGAALLLSGCATIPVKPDPPPAE